MRIDFLNKMLYNIITELQQKLLLIHILLLPQRATDKRRLLFLCPKWGVRDDITRLEVSQTMKETMYGVEANSVVDASNIPGEENSRKVDASLNSKEAEQAKSSLEDRTGTENIKPVEVNGYNADATSQAGKVHNSSKGVNSRETDNGLLDNANNSSLSDMGTEETNADSLEDVNVNKGHTVDSKDSIEGINTEDSNTGDTTDASEGKKKLSNIERYNMTLTKEEAKAISRRGGIKSGEARRERKTLGEELRAILETGDNQNRVCLALFQAALTGDYRAFNSLRDTIGEMPTQKQEVSASITDGDKALLEKVSKRLECSPETDK